jgi:hypothetical protein
MQASGRNESELGLYVRMEVLLPVFLNSAIVGSELSLCLLVKES